jgi:Xaa-Pro aminopeptidase
MEKREFVRRRKELMRMVGSNSIIIQPNSPEQVRNRDVYYPHRSDSDFHYLTGFPEPMSLVVLIPEREQGQYVLFCREKDVEAEIWHGRRAGLEGACDFYGADDAFPIEDLDEILPGLLENKDRIFYTMGRYADFDQRLIGWLGQVTSRGRAGVHAPDQFISLGHIIHEMRLFKSVAEQRAMRKSAQIAAEGHRRAMEFVSPGDMEYQVEGEILSCFIERGARSPAYPSIVGGGANSCILHYTENSDKLKSGDLLLIDAGAEYDYYASDITRTFPVNGRFNESQGLVYDIVLEAQNAAISKVLPGNRWNEPHDAAVEVLTRGLAELGILRGRVSNLIQKEAYRPYYMHKTGHWLGMDVHDVGDYKVGDEWRVFEPGMVTTVEPGLYLSSAAKGLAKKWQNIGIRIEDDVLVTAAGPEVLSSNVPKSRKEIEALMDAG